MNGTVYNLILCGVEAALIAAVILALFRLRGAFGLVPVYVALGVLQPLQVLLAASVQVEIFPGIHASPGSVVLFTGGLFALLLVYIREDALEARKVVYALVASNLLITVLCLLIGEQVAAGASTLGLSADLFRIHGRVMAVGTIVLYADVLLVIMLYEWLGRLIRRPLAVRAWLTLTAVLAFDSVVFSTGAFLGNGDVDIGAMIIGSLAGKTAMATVYAATLHAYLLWIEPRETAPAMPVTDLFQTLTYREKFERQRRITEQSEQRRVGRERAILDAVADGLFIVDADGAILELNRAAERLLGRTSSAAMGQSLADFLEPADAWRRIRDEIAANGNGPTPPHELQLLRSGAPALSVEAAVAATHMADASRGTSQVEREAFVVALRDITERKAQAERLRRTERLDAIGGLAAGVAHDVNNILTCISAANELIVATTDGATTEHTEVISDSVRRAAGLTRQLLVMGSRHAERPRHIDLQTVIDGLRGLLRRLVREDIELEVKATRGPMIVFGDPSELEQVVMNLVVNAVEAMPGGGRLSVRAHGLDAAAAFDSRFARLPAGRYVVIEVEDSGAGLSPEAMDRAFEPFFTTRRDGRGTGLGLATVRRIVESAHGGVHVDSVPGQGTCVRVFLPRATADRELPSGSTAPPATPAALERERILLCDDNEAVGRTAAALLTAAGHAVHYVTAARDALAWLQQQRDTVDVIIADLVMPQMSGRDLAKAARAIVPAIRVVHISGYADDASTAHGGDPVVTKPFSLQSLTAAIRATAG